MKPHRKTVGFTIIEVLMVVGLVAVLGAAVALTLNPSQLLKQVRDSQRTADLATLTKAIGAYQSAGGSGLGTAGVVYLSLPDSSSTCGSWDLPFISGGWAYSCQSTSTYQNPDGTGWIPVNLSQLSVGASLSELPRDPINDASADLYYTYVANGSSFELTAYPESSKYRNGGSGDVTSRDGGQYVQIIERGSRLALTPEDARSVTAPPQPSAVVVSGAGTGSANATYTYRGMYGDKAFYNKVGEIDHPLASAISFGLDRWEIYSDTPFAMLYYSVEITDNPWEVSTWVVDGGSVPVPTVTEDP